GRGAKEIAQFLCFRGISYGDDFGLMFASLFEEQFEVVAGGQADELKAVGQILSNLDGAGADGAGAAEQNNPFHLRFTICDLRFRNRSGVTAIRTLSLRAFIGSLFHNVLRSHLLVVNRKLQIENRKSFTAW